MIFKEVNADYNGRLADEFNQFVEPDTEYIDGQELDPDNSESVQDFAETFSPAGN